MAKINPFRPNSPVHPGMFIGRLSELGRLEAALIQTRSGSPVSFIVTGERGIGKTSLLNYLRWVAEGSLALDGEKLRFLVLQIDIDETTTRFAFGRKIEIALTRELATARAGIYAAFLYPPICAFIARWNAGLASQRSL